MLNHDLGKDEARKRVKDGASQILQALSGGAQGLLFKANETWTSEDQLSFTAKGLGRTITGTIDIFPQHVRIEAHLPNALATLAELISGRVEKQGKLLLEKKG